MSKRLGFMAIVLLVVGCSSERNDRTFDLGSGEHWIGNAVCYGPHRDGQSPDAPGPSQAELREDLTLMLPHWSLLRVYGSRGPAEDLLEIIDSDSLPMKVVLGVWIAPDDASNNAAEVAAAIRLANNYPGIVVAVSVGNETQVSWSAHRSSLDQLINHVRTVRAGVSVPVSVADDFAWWSKPESRRLAAEIDFLMVHAHPMWNGLMLGESLSWLQECIADVAALHPDQLLVVAETGWATSVHDKGEQAELIHGQPGEAQQAEYYQQVRQWAHDTQTSVFFFEAFNENWKGGAHPAEVEKHWGVFFENRSPKAAIRPLP
jgi:exo-beta-1,3-glucanase (GH17 family)